MTRIWSGLLILTLLGTACHEGSRQVTIPESNRHAEGFSLEVTEGYTRVTVTNPWRNAREITMEYLLLPKGKPLPPGLSEKRVIRTPVERVICMSTSHIAFLEALGESEKITGVSGSQYISSPSMQRQLSEGKTRDVGYGQNLNYEEIIRQQPDLVMLYGVDSEITSVVGKLEDLGIPVVMNAEYLETSPLGKAEWIRFIAAFTGKEPQADSLFRETEARYLSLMARVKEEGSRPAVLVGLPYRDTWWIPGGDSYLAKLISDAGGEQVTRENRSRESITISLEEAVTLSTKAEVWINTGNVSSKAEILAADSRMEQLPAFRNARIFNNNKRITPGGGNDFWESGTLHPDLILEDLIRIFHPGTLPEGEMHYYSEVQ